MSLSSKLRVLEYEPQMNLGMQRCELASVLFDSVLDRSNWNAWYNDSYALILYRAKAQLEQIGITSAVVRRKLIDSNQAPRVHFALERCIKKGFQAEVLRLLVASEAYNHEHVIRHKLGYWHLTGAPEGTLARRACKNLHRSLEFVPVKVAFVLFRTWCNGWCTARRFQVRRASCLLGCGVQSTFDEECFDSIQHYAYCPIVARFAERRLQMPHSLVRNLMNFLCLNTIADDEMWTLQLLLLYAVYRSTNCIRFSKAPGTLTCMDELLLQFVHQGASQSRFAQQIVHKHVTMRSARRRRTS